MAKKELSWQFIRETGRKKYFLVQSSRDEYFIFRTPGFVEEGSKNFYSLANWEGEIVPWGSTPAKVRSWLVRKKVKPTAAKSTALTTGS
ncbi:MAG: hypothetical protein A2126_03915 [Candidatus Woykebacteria bacterium GWB1_45_5]|uniref:Uncharacterized protein n=1 Tax=Candidatus Woykebacteria bacterium GWB1_45_5 TaxID=1802592 RepID=A0A1G1W3Q7_9BACT|nr:MAG: hypothetical protein A2126_03915 [Candidatus Woykebacteria bacterium GWB1_45_5]